MLYVLLLFATMIVILINVVTVLRSKGRNLKNRQKIAKFNTLLTNFNFLSKLGSLILMKYGALLFAKLNSCEI